MQNIGPRPALDAAITKKLAAKTLKIISAPTREKSRRLAATMFKSSRDAKWLKPAITAISLIAGDVAVCMYCSFSEPSQVEHYRPKARFPELAFSYTNFLWCCSICNSTYKGEQFPDSNPDEIILNPIDGNVWDFFFLDERFGRLIKNVVPGTQNYMGRAVSTCNVVKIDRETLQTRRHNRLREMRELAQKALDDYSEGATTFLQLKESVANLRSASFQVDVADYFLNGPGRIYEPFRSLLGAAGEVID
jgi:hypothetical protein